jgi:hypothetical protein
MGTKNNPGAYDCYANADPDEPMFVLLARDPSASLLVGLWAFIRERMGENPSKVEEARVCAEAMEKWLMGHADEAKEKKAAAVAELWSTFEFGFPVRRGKK